MKKFGKFLIAFLVTISLGIALTVVFAHCADGVPSTLFRIHLINSLNNFSNFRLLIPIGFIIVGSIIFYKLMIGNIKWAWLILIPMFCFLPMFKTTEEFTDYNKMEEVYGCKFQYIWGVMTPLNMNENCSPNNLSQFTTDKTIWLNPLEKILLYKSKKLGACSVS